MKDLLLAKSEDVFNAKKGELTVYGGPPKSGKTTTLFGMVKALYKQEPEAMVIVLSTEIDFLEFLRRDRDNTKEILGLVNKRQLLFSETPLREYFECGNTFLERITHFFYDYPLDLSYAATLAKKYPNARHIAFFQTRRTPCEAKDNRC